MIAAELAASARAGRRHVEDGIPQHLRPAAQRRDDRFEHRRAAADGRQPVELHGKAQHQEEPQPVDRHGDAELGEQHRHGIDERALAHRGEDAERHADQRRQQQRHHGELDGRADAAADDLADRGALEDRAAEIAMQQLPEIGAEPDIPGIIEPERAPEVGDHFGRRLGPEQHGCGIARHQQQQAEGDDDHADRHGDQQQQAADDIG
jgi:hypothetical protein